jgi:hypothetical protein
MRPEQAYVHANGDYSHRATEGLLQAINSGARTGEDGIEGGELPERGPVIDLVADPGDNRRAAGKAGRVERGRQADHKIRGGQAGPTLAPHDRRAVTALGEGMA